MNKSKKFRVLIECEMEFDISKQETEDTFTEDSDFSEICENIAIDCLDSNAEKIKIVSLQNILGENNDKK